MDSILITGGLGFIGSRFAKLCIEKGHNIKIIDKRVNNINYYDDVLDKFDEMLNPLIDRHKEMSLWIDARDKEIEKWNDKKAEFIIEIDRLTQWKNTVTKVLWIMGGSTLGLLAKNLLTLLVE